jgi:diguanylate cyclase (GGDEF)-like protein
MEIVIALGLIALWLALSAISFSVTRRLRLGAATNEHMALHDLLTGLPNRALFGDRVAHAIAAARRSSEPVGIAIIDLDRFKEVNDSLGHGNGDIYLCHISQAIAAVLRPGDTLARLGGDEFGLVLPGVDPASARIVLERVQRTLAADIDIAGVPVSSEASIGIAFWPTDGTEIHDLLQCADLAMYAAKANHQAVLEYTTDLAHFSPERLALVSQLRHAIAANELVLHYQPKLDLRVNRVRSVEALLRWQHPTRGLLPPAEFLEIAESTGLIDPLTDWVLENAIAQIARWRRTGVMLDVAVNVSARNLRSEALANTVFRLLAFHEVPPESLEIEITETALIADPIRATSTLQRLRDHGVRVSLDDFGRGYTSFAQLGSLPLAELKIDGSFVTRMLANTNDHTIVTTVIELGHNFGLEVVGEGAETPEIVSALAALGCDTAQGFALTPALPPDQLTSWIEQYERKAPASVA